MLGRSFCLTSHCGVALTVMKKLRWFSIDICLLARSIWLVVVAWGLNTIPSFARYGVRLSTRANGGRNWCWCSYIVFIMFHEYSTTLSYNTWIRKIFEKFTQDLNLNLNSWFGSKLKDLGRWRNLDKILAVHYFDWS